MKLSQEDTNNLKEILNICAITGIDAIIIENGIVRGMTPSKTCAIVSNINVPKFPQKIGLSRLSALRSRFDLFSSKESTVDAKETDRGEISQLEISAAKSKVQFRCTSSALIKAPLSINDRHDFNIFMTKDETKTVLDSVRIMSASKIVVSILRGAVSFKIADESNDSFSIELTTPPEVINAEESSAVITYSTQVLSAIVKFASQDFDTLCLKIGQRGTATMRILNRDVVVLPEVGEQE